MIYLKNAILALSLVAAASSQVVFGQTSSNGATNAFTWMEREISGNKITFQPSSAVGPYAGKFELAVIEGKVAANSAGKLAIGNASVPLRVVSSIPPSVIAKAIGNFAVKVAPPVMLASAVYDLLKELDFDAVGDVSGALQFAKIEKSDGTTWTTSPIPERPFPSALAACNYLAKATRCSSHAHRGGVKHHDFTPHRRCLARNPETVFTERRLPAYSAAR